jgi:2-isopropylmalate synthase
MTMPFRKYRPYPPVELADRTWPDTRITKAPIWTSVDLRDGNQALDPPMDIKRKRRMFDLLLDVGFNEIEIGFPAASEVEFEFTRTLEREDLIPDGVSVMVLTQARSALIRRTFDSLDGLPRAIVHLYNSTSTTQRRVVFGLDRDGIRDIAVEGAKLCRELAEQRPDQDIRFEYSPESYTATEPDFALEICEAVMDVLEPTPDRKLILNLPATVELSTPNLYADMIEAFCRNISRRDSLTISLHPHNDRGTAVAATELALMAGADRVEGTLFGNGERTGNVDIITLALNLMAQGVDPGLNFSNLEEVRKEAEYCNRLPVHERHPYAGELIFTAFSGSHQDAIHKGMQAMSTDPGAVWDVPYLPIDPKDVGTKYDDAVRVNSQSGKGGVAYLMRAEHDLVLPRLLQIEFTRMVQREVEETGEEITAERLIKLFRSEYNSSKVRVVTHEVSADDTRHVSVVHASLQYLDRAPFAISGSGNGTIAAFTEGIEQVLGLKIRVRDYSQQTLSDGTDAKAMSYVKLSIGDDMAWGVGEDTDTAKANFDAILSAVSRIPHALDRFAIQTSDDEVAMTPLQLEFTRALQQITPSSGPRLSLVTYSVNATGPEQAQVTATVATPDGEQIQFAGTGVGTIAAFVDALRQHFDASIDILDYAQQILLQGTEASAISTMTLSAFGSVCHGVAEDRDTVRANFEAILDAVGRAVLGAESPTRATPLERAKPADRSA